MITISAEGTGIERLAFEPLAGVMSIPRQARPLEEVLQAIGDLPDGDVTLRSPYLEIKILMTEPEPSYKYKIEEALKGKAVRLARITAMLPQKRQAALSPLPTRSCKPSVRWIWHWMFLNENMEGRRCPIP